MARLNVAFLWHMHQPCYRSPGNRAFRLPWVRLHALKDYFDMVRATDRFPGLRVTFNLVPSLLDQLAGYAEGASDVHLDLTALPAAELGEQQRCQVLRDFFMANWQTMIRPHPRYWELLEKRGCNFREADLPRIARRFTAADLLDLQVWFTLSWVDPLHFEQRADLRELRQKGRGFTEQDKQVLLAQQAEILRSIIPAYRAAWEAGRIEVSTTPYYHPILPLLCDSDVARQCMPGAALPPRFAYPGDAAAQIARGLDYAERLLGRRPAGIWPSEGSVSEQAYDLIAAAGARWLATDEGILARSLALPVRADAGQRYQAWALRGQGSPAVFFRDQQLSDLIGFSYAGWKAADAAQDMVGRLEQIASGLGAAAERHVVPIMLDGENCWEFYPGDGREFLDRLYAGLQASDRLQCCTFSDYLDRHQPDALPRLAPGSWINGDFGIWIGQDEDNQAWTLLLRAR
ncbi:MAG TPA: glycoside hydrolase family 57 protein, partial [Candidatus Edwardsbacteria bacterium]|nr:glycoside hydrolase family 57 protein [Candidatus Edwardsbacteria bacterium]